MSGPSCKRCGEHVVDCTCVTTDTKLREAAQRMLDAHDEGASEYKLGLAAIALRAALDAETAEPTGEPTDVEVAREIAGDLHAIVPGDEDATIEVAPMVAQGIAEGRRLEREEGLDIPEDYQPPLSVRLRKNPPRSPEAKGWFAGVRAEVERAILYRFAQGDRYASDVAVILGLDPFEVHEHVEDLVQRGRLETPMPDPKPAAGEIMVRTILNEGDSPSTLLMTDSTRVVIPSKRSAEVKMDEHRFVSATLHPKGQPSVDVQAAIMEVLEENDGFCMDDPGEREQLATLLEIRLREFTRVFVPEANSDNTDEGPAPCDHSGIGLPGCETCDMSTDKNQDRQRRGESPVCIDCGGEGKPVADTPYRHCEKCDVSFGWMVPGPNTVAARAKELPDAE